MIEHERDPRLESVLLHIQRTGETRDGELRAVAIQRGLVTYNDHFDILCLTRQGRRLLHEAGLA
jgi:hypothetical protein